MPLVRKPKPYRHPRSLDALFPKPKVKRCHRGHSQTPEWRAIHGCSTCRKQDEERRIAEEMAAYAGAAEREAWRERLGPPPAELVMVCGDGKIIRHRIPKHLQRKPGSRRRRRRI